MPSLPSFDALAPANQGVRAVRSGAWSAAATWGGKTPAGRIVIPAGVSVVADAANTDRLKSVRVEGCLELSGAKNNRLNTEFLYVAPGGELLAGAPTRPVPADVTAEIVFPDFGPLDTRVDRTLVGKGLVAASRVRIFGALKTPRVKVAIAPRRGETTIRLQSTPSGWRAGDRVILTGTRFIPQTTKGDVVLSSPTEDEIRFIKSVSGASVTLDSPLAFDHPAPDASLGAYLVNYSRNVRLATENGARLPASQRAHSMFLSTETTMQGVEFFEMGRTDKSQRAIDTGKLGSPTPASNIKGRYPLHLHQQGFPADALAPVVRGVAIWGSPGWGFAQHGGKAFVYQSNVYNAFGAAFMAESGNETGAWVENAAIKGVGVNHIVKDGDDVIAFDLGRTGDGFWLQSRMVRLHRNLAVGMTGGIGFVFFHRNNDLGDRFPLTAEFVRSALCTPGAMRFQNQSIDKPAILQFTENEVIASDRAFHVVKERPLEPHDIRSVIDDFKAWEVSTGIDITYTSRYTIKDSLVIGAKARKNKLTVTTGVVFGRNTYDLALVNSAVRDFDYGVDLSKLSTRIFAKNNRYTLAGVKISNSLRQNILNQDASDQMLASVPARSAPRLDFVWGPGLVNPTTGVNTNIKGTKTDSSGTTPYPIAADEFRITFSNVEDMLPEIGWWTLPNRERAVSVPEFYSDRIHGDIYQTRFVLRVPTGFAFPARLIDGSPGDQGTIDVRASAPAALDDSASVLADGLVRINAFANDRSNDGKIGKAGHSLPRNGNVTQLADGVFEYRPFPDFRGADRFDYWIKNRQGVPAKATVTVTVR
ncbi:MAG: G8 domain-containing protein [Parvularculaceae bacterium]|nr:G8 domain-containing protein [Parvularculaceae bacterium]